MGDGVNPISVIRVDEAEKGLIVDGANGGTRKKGRLAGGVRDKLTMGEMKARMAALWKAGDTLPEIAAKVSDEFNLVGGERFSSGSIGYHIDRLKKYWRDVGLLHIDERMSMILARYDQLEMLAMEAYFASCGGRSTTHYEKSSNRARSKEREKLLLEQIQEERERRREELSGNKKDNPAFQFEFDNGELEDILITTEEKIKEYSRVDTNLAGDPKWVSILVDINDKRAALWGMKNRRGPSNEDQERAKLSDEQRDARLAAVLSAAAHRRAQGQQETNLAPMAPLGGWEEGDVVPSNEPADEVEQVEEPPEPDPVMEDEEDFHFDFLEDILEDVPNV